MMRTSYATSNSLSASAAGCMIGRSESLPMTTPTIGASVISAFPIHDRGRSLRQRTCRQQIISQHGHMPDLSARARLFAVEMQMNPVQRQSLLDLTGAQIA